MPFAIDDVSPIRNSDVQRSSSRERRPLDLSRRLLYFYVTTVARSL